MRRIPVLSEKARKAEDQSSGLQKILVRFMNDFLFDEDVGSDTAASESATLLVRILGDALVKSINSVTADIGHPELYGEMIFKLSKVLQLAESLQKTSSLMKEGLEDEAKTALIAVIEKLAFQTGSQENRAAVKLADILIQSIREAQLSDPVNFMSSLEDELLSRVDTEVAQQQSMRAVSPIDVALQALTPGETQESRRSRLRRAAQRDKACSGE